MTYRERMLAALQGRPTDCLPFVPRLDLWYSANRYNGTLPDKYRKATLLEIVSDLDVGYHSVSADRHLYDDSLDIVDRALGIWRVRTDDHLILSIADTAPPGMKFSRLERIARLAKEFGP